VRPRPARGRALVIVVRAHDARSCCRGRGRRGGRGGDARAAAAAAAADLLVVVEEKLVHLMLLSVVYDPAAIDVLYRK